MKKLIKIIIIGVIILMALILVGMMIDELFNPNPSIFSDEGRSYDLLHIF